MVELIKLTEDPAQMIVEAPETAITTTEADEVSPEASQVGFGPGETFTVRELLYGLMLPSGNDAAEAKAFHVDTLPKELVFDHGTIVADYLAYKRTGKRRKI